MIKSGVSLSKDFFLEVGVSYQEGLLHKVVLGQGGEPLLPWIQEWLVAYQEGEPLSHQLPLDKRGLSPFTKRVLQELSEVPFGSTLTYKELAIAAGCPQGYRAVARVCARNPWPLFIPCHRIINTGGRLGGFAFGLPLKEKILQFEKTKMSPVSKKEA